MIERGGAYFHTGHILDVLRDGALMPKSVNCVVTSTPYWKHRGYEGNQQHWWTPSDDYDQDHRASPDTGFCTSHDGCGSWYGALGDEPSPELFVEHICWVFDELWEILRDDGTCWLNIGDTSYSGSGGGDGQGPNTGLAGPNYGSVAWRPPKHGYLKSKEFALIPYQIAIALQKRGWYIRTDIIWERPNAKPESARDRPTRSHEYVYLLTKREDYWYDPDGYTERRAVIDDDGIAPLEQLEFDEIGKVTSRTVVTQRPVRSIWRIPINQGRYSGENHHAGFPPGFVERCILLGCPPDGSVLDPFGGTGTTIRAARKHGRKGVYIDCSDIYTQIAVRMLDDMPLPLFASGGDA